MCRFWPVDSAAVNCPVREVQAQEPSASGASSIKLPNPAPMTVNGRRARYRWPTIARGATRGTGSAGAGDADVAGGVIGVPVVLVAGRAHPGGLEHRALDVVLEGLAGSLRNSFRKQEVIAGDRRSAPLGQVELALSRLAGSKMCPD
jgi:hypothetical protein